jgi:hypothetical protein
MMIVECMAKMVGILQYGGIEVFFHFLIHGHEKAF